jgi:YD repeat-containing protein
MGYSDLPQRPVAIAGAAIVLAFLMSTEVLAQSRTFSDSSGRVTGRASTDSSGAVTLYDASGRAVGRATTDSQGTTTFYDDAGRKTGTITITKKSK